MINTSKNILESIDANATDLKTEKDHITVDMEVQEFDENYSNIEDISEFDDKMIKYLERMIRGSYEYKSYIKYLKDELDITQCALTPGLNLENFHFQLEFHHYPLSLYDIVNVVGSKMIADKSSTISLFDIMNQVMKEHYEGNVGLVPLSSTAHEMFHNGSVEIPLESVYGDYNNFLIKYKDFISPELSEKIIFYKSIHIDDAKEFNQKLTRNTLDYNIVYNK